MRDQEGRKWILVAVSVLCAKVTALDLSRVFLLFTLFLLLVLFLLLSLLALAVVLLVFLLSALLPVLF